MNDIIINGSLIFVVVLSAGVGFCIWPLENILRRKAKKDEQAGGPVKDIHKKQQDDEEWREVGNDVK